MAQAVDFADLAFSGGDAASPTVLCAVKSLFRATNGRFQWLSILSDCDTKADRGVDSMSPADDRQSAYRRPDGLGFGRCRFRPQTWQNDSEFFATNRSQDSLGRVARDS